MTFDEIHLVAVKNQRPFCIILTDTTEDLSKEYIQSLQGDFNDLTGGAVFDIVDVSSAESKGYIKWLTPVSFPLTCVFSNTGELIDLIPGAAKETFLYTEQALKEQKITDYHWPNRFGRNKADVVPLLNQLFTLKKKYRYRQLSMERI